MVRAQNGGKEKIYQLNNDQVNNVIREAIYNPVQK